MSDCTARAARKSYDAFVKAGGSTWGVDIEEDPARAEQVGQEGCKFIDNSCPASRGRKRYTRLTPRLCTHGSLVRAREQSSSVAVDTQSRM